MLKALLFSCAFMLVSFTTKANTYYVTTKSDTGFGSLRSLIDTANNNPGLDTIILSLGVHDTIHIASPMPAIVGNLVITGLPCQNPTINGDSIPFNGPAFFDNAQSATLTINYLNIFNCRNVLVGGAGAVSVFELILNYCFFYGNFNQSGWSPGSAGAVSSHRLSANNSSFEKNTSNIYDQADSAQGAGAVSCSIAFLNNCTFVGNISASFGGAINSPIINMSNCTIYNNHAAMMGGGIFVPYSVNHSVISNSIIWGNQAEANPFNQLFFSGIYFTKSNSSYGCNILQDSIAVNHFELLNTDITGTDPQLGTFGYYSGCVPVLPILCGSIAQNHAGCLGATTSDAEGIIAQGIRDAGAFEITRPVLGGDTIDSIPHGGTASLYNYFNTTGYTITWPAGLNDSSAAAVDTGTYTVIATNLLGCSDTATATILYNSDTLNIGLKSISASTFFKLFPNPAQNETVLLWGDKAFDGLGLQITDMLGRTVLIDNINGTAGKYTINTNAFSSGVYCVSINQAAVKIFSGKLVVLSH